MKIRSFIFCIAMFAWFAGPAHAQENCAGGQIFTAAACAGDGNSADEKALLELVNKYRAANGRAALPLSASLSKLGNRRMLDLRHNVKRLSHSWSNCPYNMADEKTWPCVIDAPKRLNSGYSGQGYETLYYTSTGTVSPGTALDAWKKSSLHNSIILNQDVFKNMVWDEIGIAIDGQFAALWFGYPGSDLKVAKDNVIGIGVSYDQAVAGLSKLLSIEQASTTVNTAIWEGFSSDKKIKLEISGTRKDISEANVAITVRLDPTGKLDPEKKLVLAKLLKNCFPEWPDIETWIDTSINMIAQNPTAWRTKVVRKIAIDMKADGGNSLKISIKPQSKPGVAVGPGVRVGRA